MLFRQQAPDRMPRIESSDLIDVILTSDAETSRMFIFDALQSGQVSRHDVESAMTMAARLDRVAGPRPAPELAATGVRLP